MIHESDAQRIVLLIDLHHPEPSEERRRLLQMRIQVTRWSVSGPSYAINYEDEVTQGEGGGDELWLVDVITCYVLLEFLDELWYERPVPKLWKIYFDFYKLKFKLC